MVAPRNRIGALSLAAAAGGFLLIQMLPLLIPDLAAARSGFSVLGLLGAFFEASLVGALADWFAVAALFKRPLGLNLPHVDILARNKDAVAEAVPRFLTGFVSPGALSSALAGVGFAAKARELLAGPLALGGPGGFPRAAGEAPRTIGAREELHAFLRDRISSLLLSYGSGEGAASLRSFADDACAFAAESLDAPREAAALLRWAGETGFDQRAVSAVAGLLRLEIERNKRSLAVALAPLIKRQAGWKGIFLGGDAAQRLVDGIAGELARVESDPRSELRVFVLGSLASYASRLAGEGPDPGKDRERLSAAFRLALAEKGFREALAAFAGGILARVGADLALPEGRLVGALDRIEEAFAERLGKDAELARRVDSGVASLIASLIERTRLVEGLTEYLIGLLKKADARDFVARVEAAVWNDLQYIRVNGAVVGGLAGLAIAVAKGLAGAL